MFKGAIFEGLKFEGLKGDEKIFKTFKVKSKPEKTSDRGES